jgi:2-iminobutanoate/2-iminopropanoate deaminase
MQSVIKTTIFLASMDDFATVNEIYAEAFGSHKPVRSTVAVKTLPKNALVEIDAVALVK